MSDSGNPGRTKGYEHRFWLWFVALAFILAAGLPGLSHGAPPSSFVPWIHGSNSPIAHTQCARPSRGDAIECACQRQGASVCVLGGATVLKCGPTCDATNTIVTLVPECDGSLERQSLPAPGPDPYSHYYTCKPAGTPPLGENVGVPGFCPSANPVNPRTGNKIQVETDYMGTGRYPLRFERIYGSDDATMATTIGAHWRHMYDRQVVSVSGGPAPSEQTAVVFVRTWDGKILRYQLIGPVTYRSLANPAELLTRLESAGVTTGWERRTAADDQVEVYSADGRLTGIRYRAGVQLTLRYDASNRLQMVSDPFGRALTLTYSPTGQVAAVRDPGNNSVEYTYQTVDFRERLVSVRYPGDAIRIYHYEDDRFPFALTGITDENGDRYASWTYDANGLVQEAKHAGDVDRYQFSYEPTLDQTFVTDPRGTTRTHKYETINNTVRMTGVSGAANAPCGNPRIAAYSGSLYPASVEDYNGNLTTFQRADPYGRPDLETRRTEASGTPEQRTVATEWHPTWRLPVRFAEPLRITTYVYGDSGDPNPGNQGSVLSRTVQATADTSGALGFAAVPVGLPRTWTYTYNSSGHVLTIDGPRTDVADVLSYVYHADDDPDFGKRGNIAAITNGAGHVTRISAYDSHGQPLAIVDPSGLTTTLTYDSRRRLTSRTIGGETTSYEHDGVGQVTRVTLSDGSFLSYTYDAAHRLTAIADNLGNRISYTLDAMGNRLREDGFDPTNTLAQTRSRMYSNLNRLTQDIGGANPAAQITQYGYDNQGNVTGITDPLNRVTVNAYDALNRLKQMTDPANGVTGYGYDGRDRLTSVTDPRSNATSYSLDGLGNLLAQSSPDTGNTANTQDAAGNLLASTDAKGQTTSYSYDALNRVIRVIYNQALGTQLKQVDYGYDQGANGIGRLSSMTETSAAGAVLQTTTYAYDQRGRLISEARAIGGATHTTGYSYDVAGRMTGMTYPSGRMIVYGLDGLSRVSRIETTGGGTTQVVVQDVAYQPFGPAKGFTFGNLLTSIRTFDLDGRIATHSLAAQTKTLSFDAASRITRIEQQGASTNFADYGYDALDRLTSTVLPTSTFSFGYDAVGNRVSKSIGASSDVYTYPTTSNRLAAIAGSSPRTYSHDANGSITGDGVKTFGYDARGRLVSSTSAAGSASYQVDALGQRVRKTSPVGDTIFHYDGQGRLLAESSPSGAPIREYLWLDDQPVAVAAYSQGIGGCQADPALDSSNTFVAFARRERMEVHGGRPGEKGWEWGLGTNTRNFAASARADLDWVSGRPYGFVLTYDGAGNAQVTVRDGASDLFTLSWSGGMDVGNALKFIVRSPAGIGAGNRISVAITRIDGQPVSEVLATTGDDGLSEVARVYAGSSLQNGYSIEGTVTFTFTRNYPPRGNRLDFTVTAGSVTCQGQAQAPAPVLYYVDADHLNTPRAITDPQQRVVWRWDNQEPFGNNPPEENPGGLGNFEFNLRFPGQYADKETGLFYNYFRDYDPQTGRYVQSDPIGLAGGINPYTYAYDDPVRFSDPMGLDVYMCKRPLRALGGSGTRSGPDIFGNPLYHQYACVVIGGTQICGGQTIERASESEWWPWGPGLRSADRFNPDTCAKRDDSVCMDNCMMSAIANPYRPSYGLFGPGTNCQEWADDAFAQCHRKCRGQR
jgi:RHS repeat-associated protein